MTRIPFRLVDVFAERPLAGNQLCVVPEAGGLDEPTMQALACEIGFSETTFVTEAEGDRYHMRIFMPDREIPFAGHPTLGTAFVLVSEGRVRTPVTQVVAGGEFPVEVDMDRGFARMEQLEPVLEEEIEDLDQVARAVGLTPDDLHAGLRPRVVSTGLPHLIVPAADQGRVARARRDPTLLPPLVERSGGEAVYLFALTDDGGKARMFDPSPAIVEDAATGSAAGPLGAYLAAHRAGGMPGRIAVRQGEEIGRPSVLHVEAIPAGDTWRILVGGGVFIVGEGSFDLR